MDKTKFEKIISNRAEHMYQEGKRSFCANLSSWIGQNQHMNAHESQNSVLVDIDRAVNSIFEGRKKEIINKIESSEIQKIMDRLGSIEFLFKEPTHDRNE